MVKERKFEEFETDDKKWRIKFDLEIERHELGERLISVNFVLNKDERHYLISEDIENLKKDLKDLGKLRIIKQGKEFLEK
jgi:hypothetical protein